MDMITRVERSRRFGFAKKLDEEDLAKIVDALHDRMTEQVYKQPLTSFATNLKPEPVETVPILEEGIAALEQANKHYGLAMDEHDMQNYVSLFKKRLKRNPTTVELFQLGQGNSEHSRHGFFRGKLVIDGKPVDKSLMQIVKAPYKHNPNNSLIAFHDDSSAIRGGDIKTLVAQDPATASPFRIQDRVYHPTLTAETHNFPTGVAPYPGAATGTGGRIRDNQSVGRGGLFAASGTGYTVGNLHIPGYDQPWEQDGHKQPPNLSSPLNILIEGSNGASDYGNCFGEPLILGHVQSFGAETEDGYRSWFKPIMYSEGAGQIDDRHTEKGAPEKGMQVVQLGGPAYRIGMGGGAASSLMSGENAAELDFNAVQRGDAEMEQRMNRVMRACIELGDDNPIISAHDLGAGGDSNALPEIVDPAGGRIDLRSIPVGDASLSVLEIWGNESQERNAFLIWPEAINRFKQLCEREGAPYAVVGEVTGDGQLMVFDSQDDSTPVDLPLEPILGDLPPRTIQLSTEAPKLKPLDLPSDLTVKDALNRVLRLVSVASKNWLIHKVDRHVTGLVAQQQAVGPNQLPLSNYAVAAHSLFDQTGTALAQGERPRIGLISPAAQGRMSVAEALTNIMGARITALEDIRASGNWMWAAKLPGEGAKLYEAATAMSELMIELGIAIDGGKDSLSMATKEKDRTVKAPGQLVVAAYATMADVRTKVTPDLKAEGNDLIFIDLSDGHHRLGGSALAQTFQQIGNEAPDLKNTGLLKNTFHSIQALVADKLIVSLHDRSDGGLATTLLEMSFTGNFGISVAIKDKAHTIPLLFSEELGLVIETADREATEKLLHEYHVPHQIIGTVTKRGSHITISHNDEKVLDEPMVDLREIWEDTSTQLEMLQSDPAHAKAEAKAIRNLIEPPKWQLSFSPAADRKALGNRNKPKVAVLRQTGTNGDREMAGALTAAGFDAWDVTMSDLQNRKASLVDFRGVVFPGGFSFGDVLDSGKGWAGTIRFNKILADQFDEFYHRSDTFSLGVCNGAQLSALLGWVPFKDIDQKEQPRFITNRSGRFESRFVTVEIQPSPAIMLKGMEGSRMGVWVAHGEGYLHANSRLVNKLVEQNLAPIRFVDPHGGPTENYPFNPNGSPHGITSLVSTNGRHLAMMPHPERLSNQLWQWPWMPDEWKDLDASPWLKLFQNAREWCEK
ncbi:MAG TPA: phosphoribosylformylglycinamidine synthase [Candidatus Saccharimonadia bacterium]